MRKLHVLFAALLLPPAMPVLLSASVISNVLLVAQTPARAQSAEAVGRVAKAITVRIEGATQGSGVLVKREGNRYTVLTAWHVVKNQRQGEELDIYTSDGQRHSVERGSISKIGNVDLAIVIFKSSSSYRLARIGDVNSISSGSAIWVSGFPIPTSSVPVRVMRLKAGLLEANAQVFIPNGYQLLYDNQTLPGMSGGAVLNTSGLLVGIHASAERADQISDSSGKAVATGTNQAVPIAYYSQYSSGAPTVASSSQAVTADDYLAQAKALLGEKGKWQEVIRLSSLVLATRSSAEAYFYRAYALDDLGDKQGAISDYSKAISINPRFAKAYYNRGTAKYEVGDKRDAISDFSQAIMIDPVFAKAYNNRGAIRDELGYKGEACSDYKKAIELGSKSTAAWLRSDSGAWCRTPIASYSSNSTDPLRSSSSEKTAPGDDYLAKAKALLGKKGREQQIVSLSSLVLATRSSAEAYFYRAYALDDLGDKQGAISDYSKAISINPRFAKAYYNRGTAKYEVGDKRGAIEDFSQAILIDPGFAKAYNNRGAIRDELGEKSGACSDYKRAIVLGSRSTAQWLRSQSGAWCRTRR